MVITQECCEQYWTSPGGSTPQSSICMATCHQSQKLSKLDEPDMWDTAGEVGMNSSDILLWTPSHRRAKAGWPARTYIQQLWADMGCRLLGVMDDRERWRERVREICVGGAIRWWWWLRYYGWGIYEYHSSEFAIVKGGFDRIVLIRRNKKITFN